MTDNVVEFPKQPAEVVSLSCTCGCMSWFVDWDQESAHALIRCCQCEEQGPGLVLLNMEMITDDPPPAS